jgi:hypothetical protein
MKQVLLFSLLFIAVQANAKVWRINNNPGVAADFTTPTLALASASVVNDDTLHLESSVTAYGGFTLNKRLVIIGTGYFLSGTNSNPGLQALLGSSSFAGGTISFDSTASGSTLMGIDNFYFGFGSVSGSATDNITLTRCRVGGMGSFFSPLPNTILAGWKINKCYFDNSVSLGSANTVVQNWEIRNNIFTSNIDLSNPANLNNLVRNNVFRSTVNISNGYFANNLLGNITLTLLNVTIRNNIAVGNILPAGNGNLNNQTDATVFQGLTGNSTDGQWRLRAGSPAIGAGETIGGITPDCGAYGTADPYRLSGIPAIPTIYSLTVPASIPTNATTLPVTISTRSNN